MQTAASIIIFFVFGLIVGSFMNAWVDRLGKEKSILSGRSKCMSCSTELLWYELIPLVSFVVLRGRCKTCNDPIGFRHPIIELLTGTLFLLAFLVVGLEIELILILPALALLVGILVYDLRHMIIPNTWVYPFIFLSFLSLFVVGPSFTTPSLLDALAGPILFSFFALLWLVSAGKWMGFGDAKLALGIGWFLGLEQGISSLMYAFWIGALYSLFIIGLSHMRKTEKKIGLKSLIPFAPFLILGFLLIFFFPHSIIKL